MKNRAVMLFCFSSSFPFLRNLQPPLNGNGKFGKWGEWGGVGWAAASLSLTSPIWTGEGATCQPPGYSQPFPAVGCSGAEGFSPPKCVFLVGLRRHFFINNCHILHQLLTPRLLSLSKTRKAGRGEWFSFRRLCFAGETC